MEDLQNKMYKVMSVMDQPEIIWDMRTEQEIDYGETVYRNFGEFINIQEWTKSYFSLYKRWLYDDLDHIYDIFNPINQIIIQSIIMYNKTNYPNLFFWFDVDRNRNEEFEWTICPLSKTKLVLLGEDIHPNNRLISTAYPLVFPIKG